MMGTARFGGSFAYGLIQFKGVPGPMSSTPPLIPPLLVGLPAAPQPDRVAWLDGVRGFALLGILLMNIEGFHGPLWLAAAGVDPAATGVARWIDTLTYVLVQGSFFPLFSLLFGIGFALMNQRLVARGVAFVPLHLRRMGCLLLIGLVHGVVVWSGDILLTYALLGLLLPALLVLPGRWLGWAGALGIACASLVVVLMGGLMALMASDPDNPAMAQVVQELRGVVSAQELAYGQGSFAQAVGQRVDDMVGGLQALLVSGGQILGLFLLGAWLVGCGAVGNPDRHARLWTALRWVAWPLGLGLSVLAWSISPYNPPWSLSLDSLLAQGLKLLAGSLMGLGWLAWGLRWQRLLRPLQAAGQMALTTYLTQSLVCTAVFYGYGLGWFGRLGRVDLLLFVLGLFVLQVVVARLWLHRFRQGPVEWLWRAGTYGHFSRMLRQR